MNARISPALFSRVEKNTKEAAKRASVRLERSAAPRELFLPGFNIGVMPNHLNRSSLIAPIARKKRKVYQNTIMVTRRDCVLEYTGEQLDEADADLIMGLIFFAQPHGLGTFVMLNRKELLRKIKRGKIGSSQYKWLHNSMKRLRAGTLFLEAKRPDGTTRYTIGSMNSFNILKELKYDDKSENYSYMLDRRWVEMFSNREYSRINWEKRMQIRRGLDMAKTLQRLVATSADYIQRFNLEKLKDQMVYTGRMGDFRDALIRSVDELARLEIIVCGHIGISTKGEPLLVLRIPPRVA